MNNKSTAETRQIFLDFFQNRGHQVVESSSLIPKNDFTLLFTNAGMNQFKDVFLGLDNRHYSCATTAQRCVRAGGKHNDLENVGYTAHHHTFFEMLGNFSFGNYFKYEAIKYAWELLTGEKWFNLSKDRLWVTVYKSDTETYEIWKKKIGIPTEHIICVGDKNGKSYVSDNFWQMDNTGPCGPCTEIFYDQSSKFLQPFSKAIKKNTDRYIELWNIVFIQFNRHSDGTMEKLSNPSIDTGMGLERIAAVLQDVHSTYEIDLFRALIKAVMQITAAKNINNTSLRIIADHIRSCAFLIVDGVIPSNENRGYVLRRIIRRAVRHGNMLGMKETFFYKLVSPLINIMKPVSHELKLQQTYVEQILKTEEERFLSTLERGLTLLDKKLAKLEGDTLGGKIAFQLYDTYGFPLDLTADVCRERNIKIDTVGFESLMKEQRQRGREFNNFSADYNSVIHIDNTTQFKGYSCLKLTSKISRLIVNGKLVDTISVGQKAIIILNKTPFYAESGGQIGDQGEIRGKRSNFILTDTKKYGQAIAHIGQLVSGSLKIGESVKAEVDGARRLRISLNHTATHLMHAALRKVLGNHVTQQGSMITDKYLRFDFSHIKPVSLSEIRQIEDLVNIQIRNNVSIKTTIMSCRVAREKGVIGLINKEYGEYVRVLNMGNFSTELCGGTHASRTGDIGLFCITSESSVGSGIRRVEAMTGENAIINLRAQSDCLREISCLLKKSNQQNLSNKISNMLDHIQRLEKNLQQIKEQLVQIESSRLCKKVVKIKDINLIISELMSITPNILRAIVNNLKQKLGSSIIVLAAAINGKIYLIAGVSNDVTDRVKADELISMLTQHTGGKGGGHPDMAEAGGGIDTTKLLSALGRIESWVSNKL